MNLELHRYKRTSDRVLGVMCVDERQCYHTLEPVNCIPAGTYDVRVSWSPRFKCLLPEVLNVPGRTGIRIHSGNYPKDTSGCILVGRERFSDYITNSKAALTDLLQIFRIHEKETHTIRIIDCC